MTKTINKYGISRVLEPAHVLPTSAWKLDNSYKILPHEMRVEVKTVHLEGTSFKQISLEAGENEDKIKNRIRDIIIARGKLHNPVTDTGGLFYGVVSEIGSEFDNRQGFKVGDPVVCNASLASIPMHIDKIYDVDKAFGQIEAQGYAIITSEIPLIYKPDGLPVNLLLYTFNESGTLYRISQEAVGRNKILVVGNNMLSNLLFGYAARKVAGERARIVCVLDKRADLVLRGPSIDKLTSKVFDKVYRTDILRPLEFIDELEADSLFDMSINCADIPGAETVNILATRTGGTVVFANLINNYNIGLYITESISRQLDIRCADGYLQAYDYFDIELIKDLMPYLGKGKSTNQTIYDSPSYATSREGRVKEFIANPINIENFICESRSMSSVMEEALRLARYDSNILITGNEGVGKEKVAGIIHNYSPRKMQPFVKLNCATIGSEAGVEDLFGRTKKGAFEEADNGTLILTEVEKLPDEHQARLLRVLQESEIYRHDLRKPVKINVRVIATTCEDLESLVEKGEFRRDLFYLLSVGRLRIPSLAERRGDIEPLVRFFLDKYNRKLGQKRRIEEGALDYLTQCSWKGNIKELESLVNRLIVYSKNEDITMNTTMRALHPDIFEEGLVKSEENQIMDFEAMVSAFESNLLRDAMNKHGSTRKTAKAIGISQSQLMRKKKKYNL